MAARVLYVYCISRYNKGRRQAGRAGKGTYGPCSGCYRALGTRYLGYSDTGQGIAARVRVQYRLGVMGVMGRPSLWVGTRTCYYLPYPLPRSIMYIPIGRAYKRVIMHGAWAGAYVANQVLVQCT